MHVSIEIGKADCSREVVCVGGVCVGTGLVPLMRVLCPHPPRLHRIAPESWHK